MKIVIIGGGVIGLCCGFYLNKEGYEVAIIDRHDITDGCSFGNMGYISPSHFVPLASPGIIRQGLRWMLRSSSPFYIKPRLNLDLIRWGLTFRKNANAATLEKNIPHLNNLLQLSRDLMNDLKNEFNDSFDMIEKGCWTLYQKDSTADHEKHLADEGAALGLTTKIYTAAEVQSLEPEVEVDVKGGILWLDDCHLDAGKLMRALHKHLQSAGVSFHLNSNVISFEQKDGKINAVVTKNQKFSADHIVIANGSWMPEVSRKAGIDLLMQPGKGYSFAYQNLEKNLHHPAILVEARTAMTPINRWLRLGGTMELSGHSDNILPKRVTAIYNSVKRYFPTFSIEPPDAANAWFGYRPVTPDGLPYIGGHEKVPNLTFAGGHAMLGVSAAAATGMLVTEIIGEKATSIAVSAFDPARFD